PATNCVQFSSMQRTARDQSTRQLATWSRRSIRARSLQPDSANLLSRKRSARVAAYLIVSIDVRDPVAYEDYKAKVPAFIRKHGGEYLVRGGAHEVVEGDWQP